MNIAVHAGHAVVGARGASLYMDEVKKNRLLKKYFIQFAKSKGANIKDTTVHTGSVYGVLSEIKKNYSKKCDKRKKWLNISIHLNASSNREAHGFEIFVRPEIIANKKKRQALEALCEEFCERTGFYNRGVKKSTGLYVLNNLPNCVLCEVGFVTSKKDTEIYKKLHSKKIACILADCMLKYGKEVL